MRNAAIHTNGKDLAKEIAALKTQLEELAESVSGTSGSALVARGEEALEDALVAARAFIDKHGDTARKLANETSKLKDKATTSLVETAETHPFSTLAAVLGIGFLAGYLCRRQ